MRLANTGLALVVLAGAAGCGGGEGSAADPVDFYITVQLKPPFALGVVDRLELQLQANVDIVLESTEGTDFGGDIRWRTDEDDAGRDLFVVDLTGEYFRRFGFEVDRQTWEIDIPFQGGLEPGSFGVRATVFWTDPDGAEQEIAYGTGEVLTLPREDPATPVVIEVLCRPDWQYTCRTGCATGNDICEGPEGCASGTCVDGCCVSG